MALSMLLPLSAERAPRVRAAIPHLGCDDCIYAIVRLERFYSLPPVVETNLPSAMGQSVVLSALNHYSRLPVPGARDAIDLLASPSSAKQEQDLQQETKSCRSCSTASF